MKGFKIWHSKIEFKKEDCWVGIFWRQDHLWICLLPMLPLHIWRDRMEILAKQTQREFSDNPIIRNSQLSQVRIDPNDKESIKKLMKMKEETIKEMEKITHV